MKELQKLSMQPVQWSLHQLLDSDGGTSYHIPLYQRDYKWTDTEVEDFLHDAFDSLKTNKQRFFGTVLLSEDAPQHDKQPSLNSLYVIDGQQRLTTTLLILVAMRHIAIEISNHEAIAIATRLIDRITVERVGKPREPRLTANRVNSDFLASLLSESTTKRDDVELKFNSIKDKKIQKRCESLFRAYNYCYKYIRDALVKEAKDLIVDENSDAKIGEFLTSTDELTKATEYLEQFRNHFLQNSLLVKIQITSWAESFELFDGLNNRGMELAAKDVLKNVILNRAASSGDSVVDKVEKQWQKFDEYTSNFDFIKFLRHWLLLEHEDVSIGGATRLFMSITQDEKPMDTVGKLNNAALFYSAFDTPSSGLTPDKTELRHYINLKTMGAQRVRPIMLAALLRNVKPKELCEILNSLETLHFRRSAICQLDNKTLEVSVQKIASELYESGTAGAKKAIASINKLNPSEELFKLNFQNKSGMPLGISRYMLLKIENYLRVAKGQPEIDPDDVTLEHILPQEPKEHWGLDQSKPEVKVLISRLGNLTLLRGKVNTSASNLGFELKKKLYGEKAHVLFITDDVIKESSWTHEEIAKRQVTLSEYANQVWKL
jgi:hypothetical protein